MKTIKLIDKINGSRLISARDGYQEYFGIEIGESPADKIFKIYREPEEIRKLSDKLVGIPVINGHNSDLNWDDNKPVDPSIIVSKILTSEVRNVDEPIQDATIEIYNVIEDNKNVQQLRQTKNELSVGYKSDLKESTDPRYDFIQFNIEPRHLAIEEAGRCGKVCKFIDKEFKVDGLEELLAALGLDDEKANLLKEFLSKLTVTDNDPDDEEAKKAKAAAEEEEEKKRVADKLAKYEAILKEQKDKAFKDAVMKFGNERVEAIKKILKIDPEYKFQDKTNCEIKRAVVEKAFPDKKFEDSEIPALFKIADVLPSLNIKIEPTKIDSAVDYYSRKGER
jgi:hypothetical protein